MDIHLKGAYWLCGVFHACVLASKAPAFIWAAVATALQSSSHTTHPNWIDDARIAVEPLIGAVRAHKERQRLGTAAEGVVVVQDANFGLWIIGIISAAALLASAFIAFMEFFVSITGNAGRHTAGLSFPMGYASRPIRPLSAAPMLILRLWTELWLL